MKDDGGHGPHEDREGTEIAPLPESWLPDPVAGEGDPIWEQRAARILAAVSPARVSPAPGTSDGWVTELGRWWRPTALVAATAAGVLLMTDRPAPAAEATFPDELTFTLIASDGDPAALWAALGVAADPVLALIALEPPGPNLPPIPDSHPEGGAR